MNVAQEILDLLSLGLRFVKKIFFVSSNCYSAVPVSRSPAKFARKAGVKRRDGGLRTWDRSKYFAAPSPYPSRHGRGIRDLLKKTGGIIDD